MNGAAALVPPNTIQPGSPPSVSYTATPVFGFDTDETSAIVLRPHAPGSCQPGLGSYDEQPLPAPDQAVSLQPRVVVVACDSDVPPVAVTYCEAAGYSAP